MKHRHAGYKLNRTSAHRLAMFRNMTMALIRHEQIITTVPKAKALRPFFEKLVTLARDGSLHARRQVAAKLGHTADAIVDPEGDAETGADKRTVLQKLFSDLGPRFKDRPGGYTRIIKRHQRRLGDAGETAFIELLKAGEVRERRARRDSVAAPAPSVAPDAPAAPAPETPAPEAEKKD